MLEQFKKDFWALSRESKGYYAWANDHRRELYRSIRGHRHCRMCDEPIDGRELVESLFDTGLGQHPLLDIVFDSFARAESRFGLRFVPQRSNEERLTGHLISEIEAAVHLAVPSFESASRERYGESLAFDFSYLDLSRGGHDEKLSGGDLGIVLSVDLPDRPKLLRYVAIQAKKLSGSSTLDKSQFDTLLANYGEGAAYLFYDMDFGTLAPPMMMMASSLQDRRNKEDATGSFSIKQEDVFRQCVPLSLWLLTQLAAGKVGCISSSLKDAIDAMRFPIKARPLNRRAIDADEAFYASRLALISVGKPFEFGMRNNEVFEVTLKQ